MDASEPSQPNSPKFIVTGDLDFHLPKMSYDSAFTHLEPLMGTAPLVNATLEGLYLPEGLTVVSSREGVPRVRFSFVAKRVTMSIPSRKED